MQGVHGSQLLVVLLLAAVVAFGALARRLRAPYPIVLLLGGVLISFVPGLPRATLEPDVIFLIVLPPLLYAGAWAMPWREFAFNLVRIASLAVGLVAFTVAGVAFAAPAIVAGLSRQAGFVLGAILSPTDAIAATSTAREAGLPRTVSHVLEGESLVNDATGLLALELALAMLTGSGAPSLGHGVLRFAWLVAGGAGVGLALGLVVDWFERRIEDGPIEIAISLLVPYAAYLLADALRASGVLAVVAAGLLLSRRSARFFSPEVRLQANAFWDALTFALNGFVFVLIGLQLPHVIHGVGHAHLGRAVAAGAAVSALVIALRLVWVFPAARISLWIRRRLLRQEVTLPPWRELLVIGWAGMRGVIALAAAMSLPHFARGQRAFPHRAELVFITFCVIVVTLVFQGLTLPLLIRWLRLSRPAGPNCEEQEARRIVAQAAMDRLQPMRDADDPQFAGLYDDLTEHYRRRLDALGEGDAQDRRAARSHRRRYHDISLELLQAERDAVLKLRDDRAIDDQIVRQLEHELDHREARLTHA